MRFVHIKQIAVKSAFFRSFTVKNMLCEPIFETDPQSVYPHYRYIFCARCSFCLFYPKSICKKYKSPFSGPYRVQNGNHRRAHIGHKRQLHRGNHRYTDDRDANFQAK